MRRISLVLVMTIFIFACALDARSQSESYSFGIAPIYNSDVIKEGFQPVMTYLSKSLGVPVKLVISDSYEQLQEKLKNNELNFALLGPVSYVQAKEIYPELVYLATAQSTKFGRQRAFYFGHIIVRKNSGIKTIKDLENRSFAFVNKKTTSGYNFPMVFFFNNQINPKEYFSKVVFAGTHEKAVDMVARNEIDATATHDINLWTAEKKFGKIFITLTKIGPIVSMALVANHNVPEDVRAELTDTLKIIPEKVIAKNFPYSGFQTLSDNSYDNVREVLSFPFDDYYLPDILQTALESGNLNKAFQALDELRYDKEKTYKIFTNYFRQRSFEISGSVAGYRQDVAYDSGWYSLSHAIVLNIGKYRRVYIDTKKSNKKHAVNTNLSFKGKVIGIKGIDSIVIKPISRLVTDWDGEN